MSSESCKAEEVVDIRDWVEAEIGLVEVEAPSASVAISPIVWVFANLSTTRSAVGRFVSSSAQHSFMILQTLSGISGRLSGRLACKMSGKD